MDESTTDSVWIIGLKLIAAALGVVIFLGNAAEEYSTPLDDKARRAIPLSRRVHVFPPSLPEVPEDRPGQLITQEGHIIQHAGTGVATGRGH